jgi:hypothetical protein
MPGVAARVEGLSEHEGDALESRPDVAALLVQSQATRPPRIPASRKGAVADRWGAKLKPSAPGSALAASA